MDFNSMKTENFVDLMLSPKRFLKTLGNHA